MCRWNLLVATVAIRLLCNDCQASSDSIGSNGIVSAGLGLTGAGVSIGQVEPFRSGKFGYDTDANCCNSAVVPSGVFVLDVPADENQRYDSHALNVAGVMISTDTIVRDGHFAPTGVSPGAALYSSSMSLPIDQANAALAAENLARVLGVSAINMSFGLDLENEIELDGDSQLTLFVDWSAKKDDVLYVVAGDQVSEAGQVPIDNLNGMTVAMSAKEPDGVFRRVSLANEFPTNPDENRTFTDILAPGVQLDLTGPNGTFPGPPDNSGTSLAAPHVTGTAALLHEFAVNNAGHSGWIEERARRHEVVKAVIMNAADKIIDDGTFTIPGDLQPAPPGTFLGMSRTVVDTNGQNWLQTEAYTGGDENFVPLDNQMGVGHLNASRAVQQYSSGEVDSDDADVPLIGWDLGHTSGNKDNNVYPFAQQLLGGSFISVTLAWDRQVEFETDISPTNVFNLGDEFAPSSAPSFMPENDDQINDLDIFLLPKGATSLAEAIEGATSESTVGTLEHMFFRIPETGEYEFWVHQFDADIDGGQDYGVAWWAATAANPNPGQGDYSGNGTVGPEDYAIWKVNFGTSIATADGNGNGIVDAADYTIWRDHLGQMVGSGSAATVPEPNAAWLTVAVATIITAMRGTRRDSFAQPKPRLGSGR